MNQFEKQSILGKYQGGSLMHQENESPLKIYWLFQHIVDYEGDTDENYCNTNDSKYDNDDLVRKFRHRTRV